jgi:integrase
MRAPSISIGSFAFEPVRRVLAHIDHFVTTRGGDLTPDTFAGWCLTLQHLASGTRRHRMRVVRNFCLYRRRRAPGTFVPDERLFPPDHQVIRPHLFTEAEGLGLLETVNALPPAPTSPLRRENLRLAIVILYTTGLRLGELVRLVLRDYDPGQRTLLIRDSKFHNRGWCRFQWMAPAKSIGFGCLPTNARSASSILSCTASTVSVCSNARDKVEPLSQTPRPHAERVLAAGKLAIGGQIVLFERAGLSPRRSPTPVPDPNRSEAPTPA